MKNKLIQKILSEYEFTTRNFSDQKDWGPTQRPDPPSRDVVIKTLKDNYSGYFNEVSNILDEWVSKTIKDLNLNKDEYNVIADMFENDYRENNKESSLSIPVWDGPSDIFSELPYLQGKTGHFEDYKRDIRHELFDTDITISDEDLYNRFFLNDIPVDVVIQTLKDDFDKQS
jgi:hypothetical protein